MVYKVMVPIMEEHGYEIEDESSSMCSFIKKHQESERTIVILIERAYSPCKRINIYIHIIPTFLHYAIFPERILIGTENLTESAFGGGWLFETEDDVRTILETIVASLEKKNFRELDEWANDPEDIVPKRKDYFELWEKHESYAEIFRNKYQLKRNDIEGTLAAIKEEIKDISKNNIKMYRTEILQAAAAYGDLGTLVNGRWELDRKWEPHLLRLIVVIPSREELMTDTELFPLWMIWAGIMEGENEQIEAKLLKELREERVIKYLSCS